MNKGENLSMYFSIDAGDEILLLLQTIWPLSHYSLEHSRIFQDIISVEELVSPCWSRIRKKYIYVEYR